MSDAKKCDACNALIETEGTVEIVNIRLLGINNEGFSWGNEDSPFHVCRACLNRPLRELITEMCTGFFGATETTP